MMCLSVITTPTSSRPRRVAAGFTLVEMIIAVFIFLLVILALVTLFAAQMRAYVHARAGQKDLENAQFALNYLGKSLRTATLVGAGNQRLTDIVPLGDYQNITLDLSETTRPLIFYDFSQDLCMRLSVKSRNDTTNATALFLEEVANNPTALSGDNVTQGVGYDRVDNCLNPQLYQLTASTMQYRETRLTSGRVHGRALVTPTRFSDALGSRRTETMGRATIMLQVWPMNANPAEDDPIYIQTTTALRDYPQDLSY